MKRIIVAMILTALIVVNLTGCAVSDAVEINKREYIFAVGIDNNENATGEGDKYTFTAEIPILDAGSDEKRFVITQNCPNLTGFYYNNVLETDKVTSDSLMQVLVIGEDILKDKNTIKQIFDEIERSPKLNRKVKVVVAKGKASDIINTKIPDNNLVGRYISEFLIKLKKTSIQTTYSFDEVILNLQDFGNTLMPAVSIINDRMSIDGAAVIKDYELIDYINHDENGILTVLSKGASTGMNDIFVNVDNTPVSLTYDNVTVSQNIDLKDDKLSVLLYATVYLNINSYDITKVNSSNKEFEKALSREAGNVISAQTNKLIDKMQKQYSLDLLGIQEDLIKFSNTDYQKIKDKYNQVFSDANIQVLYNVKINNSGMVK